MLWVRVLVLFVLRQAQKTILPGWTERWNDEREVTSNSNLPYTYWAGLYHACLELSRNLGAEFGGINPKGFLGRMAFLFAYRLCQPG